MEAERFKLEKTNAVIRKTGDSFNPLIMIWKPVP
jgi:hypothetical protein